MNCDTLRTLIHDYVDGTLVGTDRGLVESHLDGCTECSREASDLYGVVALLDEMTAEPVPDGFADRVIDQLRVSGRIARRSALTSFGFGRVRDRFRLGLATAMLVLLAVLILPTSMGVLEGIVGKGTVLVADAYVQMQEKVADVDFLTRVLRSMEQNLGTLKTIVRAGFSLLARAGEMLFVPAMVTMLLLVLGVLLFLRAAHRRGAEHAVYSL